MPKRRLYGYAINKKWLLTYGREHGLVPPPDDEDADPDDEEAIISSTVYHSFNDVVEKSGFWKQAKRAVYHSKKTGNIYILMAIASTDPKDKIALSSALPPKDKIAKLKEILQTDLDPTWYTPL